MLRFSSYSVISDKLKSGNYVLLNGISGATDIIGRSIGEPIEILLEEKRDDANFENHVISLLNRDTRASFLESGHLTESSSEEERVAVTTIAGAMHDHLVKKAHFMIVPNLDCNYRCTYCFERPLQNALKSNKSGISHVRGNVVMQENRVDGLFRAIEQIQTANGQGSGGQIILYGGEPLDAKNADVVHRIVARGREKGHFFAAITNGHDLEHFTDCIGAGGIEQIQISVDGLKDTHDKRRIFVGKESSFDKVTKNIDLVLETCPQPFQVQLRVHVDPKNVDEFSQLIDFFGERGWLDRDDVVIYGNTVYNKDADGKVVVDMDNSEIATVLGEIAERHTNIYTSAPAVHASNALAPVFHEGKRFELKGTYCAANTGNYIFAADGGIYACWESVGKECSKIGTYAPDGAMTFKDKAVERWFGRSIETLPTCQKCPYALVCGGGCAQYAEYESGTLYESYCDDFQRTFRTGLAEHATQYLRQI